MWKARAWLGAAIVIWGERGRRRKGRAQFYCSGFQEMFVSFSCECNHPSFGISVKAWNQASLILMLCRKLDETLLRKVRSSGDRIFAATLDR